ncbi:hypothetical protein DQ04_06921030 [Trypanosoma grayi]|uniref:hypothetical protein n=1 Tax=Trypanosoma grayi TaxID=71804 RepID=UPI0004F3F4C8|nr:hypothetical protein DQ04_06921030 [Trypanosoma grayi]KEG08557.1 hypothetical protein DQ04_06921030 [Trypanosoma grayi]
MASELNMIEVFDPNFKYMYMVPSHLVVHTPPTPARLGVSRLVACRNYVPGNEGSCTKEERCRFVHADVDFETLEAQPVHANYIWRHEDLCTYSRLPPGCELDVLLPNNRQPAERIPSERILVTQGALPPSKGKARPLSHCAHYYFNHLCIRGESCSFIHAVCVDPSISGDFKRALGRQRRQRASNHSKNGASRVDNNYQQQHLYPQKQNAMVQMPLMLGEEACCVVQQEMAVPVDAAPVQWAQESTPSTMSSEGPRHSGNSKDVTPFLSPNPGCRKVIDAPEATSAVRPLDERRGRFYRHDPYRCL